MATQDSAARRWKDLLGKLPEIYQQIYGHPEFDPLAVRKGDGRLPEIRGVIATLRSHLGRPVRVLDLGCAQGWVSMHLAADQAFVLGVDHFEPNVAVCNALAAENLGLPVRFECADLTRLPERLRQGDFDLLLGLSVFHHLCAPFGKEWVRDLIARFLDKVPNAILELALATESPAWARAQPDDPAFFVEGFAFHTLLAHSPTHLRSTRPLYFCSRSLWLRDGRAGDLAPAPAPSHGIPAAPAGGKRKLILLAGINGAGKTSVALRLARRLNGSSYLYSEDSHEATASGLDIDHGAFNRRFVEAVPADKRPLHQAIVEHSLNVVRSFPPPPRGATLIIDRWYETYANAADLPAACVAEIEAAIAAADIEGYLVNLVIDDDLETLRRNIERTRSHRPPCWWKEELGSVEDRAHDDLANQRKNRKLGLTTQLQYVEINTTAMQWDRVVDEILALVRPGPA